jgi:hypothetical protein
MDKAARAALLTAKGMDKTSENIADYVADLLRQGRASEVTDDLMAQADPQRLMHHYKSGNTGMDMPMDYASRMERAAQMGLTQKSYHGTGKSFPSFDPALGGTGAIRGNPIAKEGIFSSPMPEMANRYAEQGAGYKKYNEGGNNIPLMVKPANYSVPLFDAKPEDLQNLKQQGHASTDLTFEGNPWETVTYDPTNIRSKFARFDPRLSHLSHLSASTGGAMELARAITAKNRAGGQIAPSKYLPNVPRAVHADGGKVAFMQGNHPDVPDVLYHGNALQIAKKGWTNEIDSEQTQRNMESQDFRAFKPSEHGNYGAGIYLSDSPKVASDFAQGVRSDQKEAMPFGQVMKLHVSMKQPFTDDTLRHPEWKAYIKKELNDWSNWPSQEDEKTARAEFLKNLDTGTATVRGLFLDDRQDGTYVNQWGQHRIHEAIRNSGFDGIIAHRPDGSKEYVAFKPEQVKSALGNSGKFDPTDPDMTKAEGGAVTDTDEFRNWFGNSVTHTNGQPHVFYTGTSKDKDFTSHNVGRHGAWFVRDPEVASQYAEQNDSQGHKQDGWKLTPTNTASRVIPAYVKAENPYTGDLPPEYLRDNYKAAQSDWFDTLRAKGHDSWIPASQNGNLVVALKEPQQIKSIFNSGKFDPNQKHMNKADGGRIGKDYGGAMGYVPQFQASNAPRLAVAKTPVQSQQQNPFAMEMLGNLFGNPQEAKVTNPTPSAASEGHAGVSGSAQAAMDALRKSWDGQSFNVISDYRDPAKNQAVGGAKGSQHLHGNAFDIDTHGWTPEQKLALATNAYNSGFRGFGFYDNNMHFDVGGQRAWGPSYHNDSIPEWAQDWTKQYINRAAGGKAMALTRRFTKNGNGVTMSLKPRGK